MGQRLSNVATAASGTKAASHPLTRYGRLHRMQCWSTTGEGTVEVVEWCGAYQRTLRPGLHATWCCLGQAVAGRLSTALQHQEVQVECKTADGVFVELVFSVMYRVASDRLYEAYYSLADPEAQVTSYVLDAVSKAVAGLEVEALFRERAGLIESVRGGLGGVLHAHGFDVSDCLITVMSPASSVKVAMSGVLAARRNREAAFEQGEADKLRTVQHAEGSAESKYLQGQGLARFLIALAAGARESLKVLVTGRVKPDDLAFPQPPPVDVHGALQAAGVADFASLPPPVGADAEQDGRGARKDGTRAGAEGAGEPSGSVVSAPVGERPRPAKVTAALVPPPPLLAPQAPLTPQRHARATVAGGGAAAVSAKAAAGL